MNDHDDFGGLQRDVTAMVGRRRALALLGGAGLAGVLAACGAKSDTAAPATSTSSTTAAPTTTSGGAGTFPTVPGSQRPGPGGPPTGGPGMAPGGASDDEEGEIPSETNGPYPADGTNGPNVLTADGIVRGDITSSFGEYSGAAAGVPITFEYTVIDNSTGQPLAGHAFYLWHCTATGAYSLYEETDQNYLRGMQVTDADGKVTFTSIFPGCYAGRWPHTHFEVYESLDTATTGAQALKVSQQALEQTACEAVYARGDYGSSTANLSQLSLDTDGIFADGYADQLGTLTGDPAGGYRAALDVRI